MKRLLRYLNDYKKESVLAPLFKMLEASFELFVPLVVAQIVDVGSILRQRQRLVLLPGCEMTCLPILEACLTVNRIPSERLR